MFISSQIKSDIRLQQQLIELAQQLRNHPTLAEEHLWQYIKAKRMGVKFRRQHPLYKYIADFCCIKEKLIIEIDGGIHKDQKEKDDARDEFFKKLGYTTLRFTNEEVLYTIQYVLQRIKQHLH